jgi:hypothetical protein
MQLKEKYPKILTGSGLGLVTLRPEVRTQIVEPYQILSLIATGRPILASPPLSGIYLAPSLQLIPESACPPETSDNG